MNLFSARKQIRPEFIFLHERDIGHPFWRKFFCRVLCFDLKHVPTILSLFPRCSSPSRRCQTGPTSCSTDADLRRHRPRRRFVGPNVNHVASSTSDQPTRSSASPRPHHWPQGVCAGRAPASPRRHFIKPTSTASQIPTCVGIAAPSLHQADVHHANLLRHNVD